MGIFNKFPGDEHAYWSRKHTLRMTVLHLGGYFKIFALIYVRYNIEINVDNRAEEEGWVPKI